MKVITNNNLFLNNWEEPETELDKLAYSLYEKDNEHRDVIYSFKGFVDDKIYSEYKHKATGILRKKKLKKINKHEQKK